MQLTDTTAVVTGAAGGIGAVVSVSCMGQALAIT